MVKIAVIGTGGAIAPAIIQSLKTLTKDKVEFPIRAVTSREKQSDEYVQYLNYSLDDDALIEQLKGTNVLMSLPTINATLSKQLKKILLDVKPQVYIPSEYGFDYDCTPDSALYTIGKQKINHIEYISDIDVKVVKIITGLFKSPPFLTELVGQVGINPSDKTVTYFGSPDLLLSYTKLNDIANATATIAVTEPEKLKSKYVIKSHALPLKEFVEKYGQEKGIEFTPIYKTREDALAAGEALAKNLVLTPEEFMAALHAIFGLGTGYGAIYEEFDNELINPGEKLWKWDDTF